ncbi:hypothetical protein [Streptomyces indicus]|uniref:Lipoprotein n=1 Tax=Streptomyces indicus TaxID=417292 RepID=A0A1G8ZS60_9ACTN|nr:hypothetical protein [Streptomyces indicus]SDK17434.1 hypothetical protein SAMN05421806_105138 [Streptomyces indicus]
MRTRQLLGALTLLLALAACGEDATVSTPPPSGGGAEQQRAQEVADAWRGSDAARQWREGFFPLDEMIWTPQDAWHSAQDKSAYGDGRFEVAGALPDETGKGGITWEGGAEPLDVEVLSARDTLELFGSSKQPGEGPRLTVTGAELDSREVRTSRGPARVPVWHFTLKGYDQPLIRAALAPDAVAKAPIGPVLHQSYEQMPLEGLKSVAREGRSLVVLAGHGACDDGPAVQVLETGESVVLSASVRGASDDPCTAQLLVEKVTVRLKQPLGERVLLDAFSGLPVEMAPR